MIRRRNADLPDLNGLLVVDKPVGFTSHDVVARVRRMTGMKRVGHAGTLDPFATGVLVIAVGRTTRLLQYVQDTDKGYRAEVILGIETDSGDVDGAVVRQLPVDPWPTRAAIELCLEQFLGRIEQFPPIYSAIKVDGQKLYALARAGKPVEAPMRVVLIHSIEVVAYEPPSLTIDVRCGKGTYIRSLARDIGVALGTTGYCHTLRRTAVGQFGIANAWLLSDLDEMDARKRWSDVALAPDAAVAGLPAQVLSAEEATAWYYGRSIRVTDRPVDGTIQRVYAKDGSFVGLGEFGEGQVLRPVLVFPAVTPNECAASLEPVTQNSVIRKDNND